MDFPTVSPGSSRLFANATAQTATAMDLKSNTSGRNQRMFIVWKLRFGRTDQQTNGLPGTTYTVDHGP